MHERNLRSCRFNRGPEARDVLHRFATKRSAKVAEKNQQQRRAIG